jgi:hypothetical protein
MHRFSVANPLISGNFLAAFVSVLAHLSGSGVIVLTKVLYQSFTFQTARG